MNHFDAKGGARMVDVSAKEPTERVAIAAGTILVAPQTLAAIRAGRNAKGDVLGLAQVAGIMAAKRTGDLIPLCHPLAIDGVSLDFDLDDAGAVHITATVKSTGRTGVEMEALCSVTVAALAIYDMCKSSDRSMSIIDVRLLHKSGGKSGVWERPGG